jgi:hypothetical protein
MILLDTVGTTSSTRVRNTTTSNTAGTHDEREELQCASLKTFSAVYSKQQIQREKTRQSTFAQSRPATGVFPLSCGCEDTPRVTQQPSRQKDDSSAES